MAGVNRPKDNQEYLIGNVGFTQTLLDTLREVNSTAPIMFASSIQACLEGLYKGSIYGESKREAEMLIEKYGAGGNVQTFIFRLPNVFGKWCRPNYNSVIAAFCHTIANDLTYHINDEKIELSLLYIDDLVDPLVDLLGNVVENLQQFRNQPISLMMPSLENDSFEKTFFNLFIIFTKRKNVHTILTEYRRKRFFY